MRTERNLNSESIITQQTNRINVRLRTPYATSGQYELIFMSFQNHLCSWADLLNLDSTWCFEGLDQLTAKAGELADKVDNLTSQARVAFRDREEFQQPFLDHYNSIGIENLPQALSKDGDLKFLFFIHQALVTVQRRREELGRQE
jgi:hypothetical protein